jgi:hypothetical protein
MNPIVPDYRLLKILRGYVADNSTKITRPNMNDENHLMTLLRIVVDECEARLPLWGLEKNMLEKEMSDASKHEQGKCTCLSVDGLKQKLAKREKQVVMLRMALHFYKPDLIHSPNGLRTLEKALAATNDLADCILCDAEPVCFTNDVELDYAHSERADKSPTSGAFWKDYSEDSDISLYRATVTLIAINKELEK